MTGETTKEFRYVWGYLPKPCHDCGSENLYSSRPEFVDGEPRYFCFRCHAKGMDERWARLPNNQNYGIFDATYTPLSTIYLMAYFPICGAVLDG